MPLHYHECEHCGNTETVSHSLGEDPQWPECCGETMPRYHPVNRCHTGVFSKPIKMMSIALDNEQEIEEFRRRNPTAEISSDRSHPDFGVPIARTRGEKLRILRAEGYVEKN